MPTYSSLVKIENLPAATTPTTPSTDLTVLGVGPTAYKISINDFVSGATASSFTIGTASVTGTLAVTGAATLSSTLAVTSTSDLGGNATIGTLGSTRNGVIIGNLSGGSGIKPVSSSTNAALLVMSKGSDGSVFVQNDQGNVYFQASRNGVSSPVNYLLFAPSATGSGPSILTAGSDTNRDIRLTPAGTGIVKAASYGAGNGTTYTLATSQAANQYALNANFNLAGSVSAGQFVRPVTVTVNSDTLTTGAAPYGSYWFDVHGNLQTGFVGSRSAANFTLTAAGVTGATATDDTYCQWPALQSTFDASANQRGTAPTSGSSRGIGYAGSDQAWLHSGATNFTAIVGREIDAGIFTGATAAARLGLNIQSYGNLQGNDFDDALRIGANINTSSPGWLKAISLRPRAVDDTSGELMSYTPYIQGFLPPLALTDPPAIANRGINITAYNFNDAAFMSAGGFRIEPTGDVAISPMTLTATTTSAAIDVNGYKLDTVGAVTAGTSYAANDQVYSLDGTILTINTVDGSGTPTAFTIEQRGGGAGPPPANPVTFYAGTGANLAINLNWATVTALSVQPDGGAIFMLGLQASTSYADDAAAAAGGVAIGQLYRNGSVVQIRIS